MSDVKTLREYAFRVLAANSYFSQRSFRESFEELVEHGAPQDEAFLITRRAHISGGRIHIYLQGLADIREYVATGGQIEDLFVGKVGIADLKKVSELRAVGLIQDNLILPQFFAK